LAYYLPTRVCKLKLHITLTSADELKIYSASSPLDFSTFSDESYFAVFEAFAQGLSGYYCPVSDAQREFFPIRDLPLSVPISGGSINKKLD
jgi:hypothetical protein